MYKFSQSTNKPPESESKVLLDPIMVRNLRQLPEFCRQTYQVISGINCDTLSPGTGKVNACIRGSFSKSF